MTKKDEDLLDKIKPTAANTAQVIGEEAGGLDVKVPIKELRKIIEEQNFLIEEIIKMKKGCKEINFRNEV